MPTNLTKALEVQNTTSQVRLFPCHYTRHPRLSVTATSAMLAHGFYVHASTQVTMLVNLHQP